MIETRPLTLTFHIISEGVSLVLRTPIDCKSQQEENPLVIYNVSERFPNALMVLIQHDVHLVNCPLFESNKHRI